MRIIERDFHRKGSVMEQQIDEQDARLARLYALPDEQVRLIGGRRYLGIATVAKLLGKATETVSLWCRKGNVFREVSRSAEEYRPSYLIPYDEIERMIQEDDFPRPGNPAFRTGSAYPYPNRRQKRKPAKEVEAEPII